MEKLVYIDGDYLPYRVGFATQRTIYQLESEGLHTCSPLLTTTSKRKVNKFMKLAPDLLLTQTVYVEEFIQALTTMKLLLQGVVKGSKCNAFRVVLTDETDNFRDKIATIQPYKGNRLETEKPAHWRELRDWLLTMPYTIVAKGEEADDVVSRAMMQGHVGASSDKDLNNTPGMHYNPVKGELYEVTEAEALNNFYTQMLVGDKIDNIPGIKGIGPVKAAKILGGCSTPAQYEEAVLAEYAKVYEKPEAALTEVGQLLWMRRKEDEIWFPYSFGGPTVYTDDCPF